MRILSISLASALAIGSSVGAAGQESGTSLQFLVPSDADYFIGTEECTWQFTGSEVVDGIGHYSEHFTCLTETSDPRASGTEELDITTHGNDAVGGAWTADGVFTTDEGSWRGTGLGMVDYRGASPLGTRGRPFNYGEMTYIGEGAYDGLVMHYYVAGGNDALALAGWIASVTE